MNTFKMAAWQIAFIFVPLSPNDSFLEPWEEGESEAASHFRD
jgi:hypothetical protein